MVNLCKTVKEVPLLDSIVWQFSLVPWCSGIALAALAVQRLAHGTSGCARAILQISIRTAVAWDSSMVRFEREKQFKTTMMHQIKLWGCVFGGAIVIWFKLLDQGGKNCDCQVDGQWCMQTLETAGGSKILRTPTFAAFQVCGGCWHWMLRPTSCTASLRFGRTERIAMPIKSRSTSPDVKIKCWWLPYLTACGCTIFSLTKPLRYKMTSWWMFHWSSRFLQGPSLPRERRRIRRWWFWEACWGIQDMFHHVCCFLVAFPWL